MRSNRSKGLYWTIDQHDLDLNVSAYSYATTIPNPYFDTDNDAGHEGRDEGEIVSESASFPTAGTQYVAGIFWSHAFRRSSGQVVYDPDGGYIEFDENLSQLSCLVCDKYDTHSGTNINWNKNKFYPADPQTAAASEPLMSSSPPVESATPKSPAEGRSYQISVGDRPTEVRLHADTLGGLAAYAEQARQLARDTVAGGPSRGVVTFSRPLTWEELSALERSGMEVDGIELVTEPDADGLRWSFFVDDGPNRAQHLDQIALENDVAVLGIVSATVHVPSPGVLTRLEHSEAVFLVDLSVEDYSRSNPGLSDVSQNDVYWLLAGWD